MVPDRIQEAQKHIVPVDPDSDPQHCLLVKDLFYRNADAGVGRQDSEDERCGRISGSHVKYS
jgi:hypothetical protein